MLDLADRPVWLTSFWGFSPDTWGCVGFSDSWRREKFLPDAQKGALVVIYVTKGRAILIFQEWQQGEHLKKSLSSIVTGRCRLIWMNFGHI